MIIFNTSRTAITDTSFIATICVADNKVITKEAEGRTGSKIGEYKTHETAMYVLGMIYAAMSAGEKCFEMPTQLELDNIPKQARTRCMNSRTSHGGS